MGTVPSSLGTMSREKLLKGTTTTREIVDIIFDFLIQNIRLRDFYSLSSPDRCRKYVLFTANTIYSKFIQFQIEPQKGKDGIIMFRSVSDLTDPPRAPIGSDPAKDAHLQQQKLCLQLAYFYVRIFQIYGALALTLVDDSKFMVEHGYTRSLFSGTSIEPPGKLPYYASGPQKQYMLGPQKKIIGGGLYDIERYKPIAIRDIPRLELFQCLHSILYVPSGAFLDVDSREREYYIKFAKKQEHDRTIGPVVILSIQPAERIDGKKIQKAKIRLESGNNKAILNLTAEAEAKVGGYTDVIKIEVNPTVYIRVGGRDVPEYGALDKIQHKFTFIFSGSQTDKDIELLLWQVYKDRHHYTVESVIQRFIIDTWNKIKDELKPALLEKDERVIGKMPELHSQFTEDRDVDEHLKIQPIIDGMTRKRRFGHCVGRALQLLTTIPSLSGIRDLSSKATSSICDLKFAKDYIDTPSGTSLADTASVSSMANLFYDTITTGYPKPSLTVGAESLDEYIKFIKQMNILFMNKESSSANIAQDPSKALKNIIVQESTSCDKDKTSILLNNTFAMKFVYPYVQELFRVQLLHASNCAKIFVQVFDIRKEKGQYRIRIHPNIINKGVDELNRLSRITRNVLIKYYSDCETNYLAGVKNIENGLKVPDSGVAFYRKEVEKSDEENISKSKYEKSDKDKDMLIARYGPEGVQEYAQQRDRGRDVDRSRVDYTRYYGGTRKKQRK